MKKSVQSMLAVVVLLAISLSCAVISTPVPPTLTPVPPTPTLTPSPSPLPPTFTPNPTATATIIPTPLPASVITLDDALIGQWRLIIWEYHKTNLAIKEDVFWYIEFSSDGTVSTNLMDSFSKSNYKINGNHVTLLDGSVGAVLWCDNPEYTIEDNILTLTCSDDDVIYYLKKTQP